MGFSYGIVFIVKYKLQIILYYQVQRNSKGINVDNFSITLINSY